MTIGSSDSPTASGHCEPMLSCCQQHLGQCMCSLQIPMLSSAKVRSIMEQSEVLTHAGYPNPHRGADELREEALRRIQVDKTVPNGADEDPDAQRKLMEAAAAKAADAAVAMALEDQVLSKQVLWQKAFITEMAKQKNAMLQTEALPESESETSEDPMEVLQQLLESVAPCTSSYPVSVSQSTDRQRVDGKADRWTPLKGQQLLVKPATEEDCILLVANALMTPESDREESHWLLRRDGKSISSSFSSYSRQRSWSHHICLPWMDQPLKRAELEYQVVAHAGREASHFVVGEKKERRQIFGLTLPVHQVSWVEDDEVLSLPPGPWRDVNGLHEVITTLPGERVLVVCTMHYTANWSSELNRGRFTVVRDDLGLDGLADRGLQSVRSLGPSQSRTMIMATVDEPPPGPHLYRARAALTTGEDSVFRCLKPRVALEVRSLQVVPNRELESYNGRRRCETGKGREDLGTNRIPWWCDPSARCLHDRDCSRARWPIPDPKREGSCPRRRHPGPSGNRA
eukprot:s574_g18.t1